MTEFPQIYALYCPIIEQRKKPPSPLKKNLPNVQKEGGGGHTGQVGDHTTCSQNKHVGEFLYFKLPKLPVQVKSRAIKDVTKYVLNTDVQFTN